MGHLLKLAEVKGIELRLESYQSSRVDNKNLYTDLGALEAYGIHSGIGITLDIKKENLELALQNFDNKQICQFIKDALNFSVNGITKINFE